MLRKLYLLFLVAGLSLTAQEQRINLKGLITYHDKPQQDIHIFNISARRGAVSDVTGHFSILAKENDTLLVSGIQFYSVGLLVTKDIIQKRFIAIDLMQRVNTLSEVKVYSKKLNGFLLIDSKIVQTDELSEKEALRMPPVAIPSKSVARKLDPEYIPDPTDPAPEGGGDIIGLVNFLTGNSLKKLGRKLTQPEKEVLYAKAEILLEIHRFYGDDFFTEHLEIPFNEIDVFLAYADQDDRAGKLFKQNKFLQLTDLLYRSSLTYRKN